MCPILFDFKIKKNSEERGQSQHPGEMSVKRIRNRRSREQGR